MPRYDYACKCGNVVEEVRGYEVVSIPCSSCSATAKRVSVYAEQFISGETCPKGNARPGSPKDKYGRHRLDLVQEASAELGEHGIPTSHSYKRAIAQARRMGAPMRAV